MRLFRCSDMHLVGGGPSGAPPPDCPPIADGVAMAAALPDGGLAVSPVVPLITSMVLALLVFTSANVYRRLRASAWRQHSTR